MKKAVAFLDVLGFSNHVYEDLGKAEKIVKDINELIAVKVSGDIDEHKIIHKNSDDEKNLYKELKDKYTFEAVDFILPVSDSIFLVGNDLQGMVLQISNFLCRILESTLSNFFSASGRFPIIMRGGMSYGEIDIINSFIYHKNCKQYELGDSFNMIGKPVVEAVKLGDLHDNGPKLFLTNDAVKKLDEDEKKFVSNEDDKKYFLWPKLFFMEKNLHRDFTSEFKLRCNYDLKPIIELYCEYKNEKKLVSYYESLVCMTIEAFSKIYLIFPANQQEKNKQIAKNQLKKTIMDAELTECEQKKFLNSICY